MDMKQCSAGHFYYAERYSDCPYCGTGDSKVSTHPHVLEPDVTSPADEKTEPAINLYAPEDGVTEALDAVKTVRPVVGWLVCVEGPSYGKSYEIHKENNYLGRAAHMDICIPEDASISRDSPMVVTYDATSRSFFCGFMGGRSIVRLNGRPLLATTELNRGDVIELGKTKLMFVPFSSDAFDWNWTEE